MNTSHFSPKPQPKPIQTASPMPFQRYRHFQPTIELPDRTWPSATISKAPRWLSTDLRDGNQALIDPMPPAKKRKLFDLLVKMGYKEIEIGFPSASQTDYDFVRELISSGDIPDDVTISVLTQAREDLIERTAQSLVGAKRATIHMYNAIAPLFRRVVFANMSEDECIQLAVRGTEHVMKYADRYLSDVEFGYEFSPEIFSQARTQFAVEICNCVMEVWQPDAEREIILNLPATVEASTPNIYADQIEYFCRHINNREFVAVSLHCHNDRGTAVAATEFGLMAGADRVEGCILGNGERTGNVDLVTLGMNLYSQGIDPQIDFSDIDEIGRIVEYCTGLPIHPRTPYSGDLVYTAFSGSHQDAIKKGLEDLQFKAEATGKTLHTVDWEAPYLPIDPDDVSRSYEAVIRVNSQSGKGGMAYLMKHDYNLDLPRRLQMEFAKVVQRATDGQGGGEISSQRLWELFDQEYLAKTQPLAISGVRKSSVDEDTYTMQVNVTYRNENATISGQGNGPVSAFLAALSQLGITARVLDYSEHAMTSGTDAKAAAYVECEVDVEGTCQIVWGVGIDDDITKASLRGIVSAINRI